MVDGNEIEMTDAEPSIDLPEGGSTGHPDVDAAVGRLDDLDGLPVDEHGEVFDEIHGRLRDALASAAAPTSDRSDG